MDVRCTLALANDTRSCLCVAESAGSGSFGADSREYNHRIRRVRCVARLGYRFASFRGLDVDERLFAGRNVCLSVYLSIYLSVCLSVCLCAYVHAYLTRNNRVCARTAGAKI